MWPAIAFISLLCGGLAVYRAQRITRRMQGEINSLKQSFNQEELRRRNQTEAEHSRQSSLFDSMMEGVLVLDQEMRVELTNKAFDTLFEVNQLSRGKPLIEFVRSHRLIEFATRVHREAVPGSTELDMPGGKQLCLRVSGAVFKSAGGQPLGIVLVFHDVTRLKELENTRQEFVANVSHELRTPLSLIKGAAETLLDGAKDDPASYDRFLQMILKHTDRLTFLIEDLLTISRLEADQAVMNFQHMPIAPVAQRVVSDLSTKAAKKSITLRNDIPPTLEARMDGDRIQQVLFNLVDNAISYGTSGGWVRLTCEDAASAGLLVSVEDNGPGIPVEARQRVFERFFRLDRARSREHGGTGLGLAIVKHIVQAHDGRVWVEGESGKGARFCFTLPPG